MKIKYLLLTVLFAVSAQADTTTVSGSVFGTWTPDGNPYLLVGNMNVPIGRTLTIEPGVLVECFGSEHSISVAGALMAEGTAEAPITFTIDTIRWPDRWRGIRIAAGSAVLRYCTIESARNIGGSGELIASGVNCQAGDLEMTDCIVQYCKARSPVGVYDNSTALIERCVIRYNQLGFGCCGGGIGVRGDSHADIISCNIHNNSAIDGGGIYVGEGGSALIERCEIADNVAQIWGGGIFAGGNGQVIVNRCFILDNEADGSGGGIDARSYNAQITRCNFVGNFGADGAHVYTSDNPVHINSCIFAPFNGPFGGLEALYLTRTADVRYCSIYSWFQDEDFNGDLPDSLGVLDRVNANGDSCDACFNIYSDPEFVSSFNDNWNLLPESPCIDAGNPSLPLDPDSTTADVGALYYAQGTPVGPTPPELPQTHVLLRAYPNPFNPTTNLSFTLEKTSTVRLQIVDLLGRTADVLVDAPLRPGQHDYEWRPFNLPSGIYFAEFRAGSYSTVQKLVLLK